jgi:hypothetical protein
MSGLAVAKDITATAMANRFTKYQPESERTVRKVEVVEDETLKQLKKAWKAVVYNQDVGYDFEQALKLVAGSRYSAADVEKLSLVLAEFQDEGDFSEKAGHFLSALINNGNDADYVIHTAHLAGPLDALGFRNTKNITVYGDVGLSLAGSMTGGSITVKGNADNDVGCYMEGGIIIIEGNAEGYDIGVYMTGGEIHVEGEMVPLCDVIKMIHGKIFHKGELIVDK